MVGFLKKKFEGDKKKCQTGNYLVPTVLSHPQGYFEGLRMERAGGNGKIRVNMLCPGPTFSELLAAAATEAEGASLGGSQSPGDHRMTAGRCAELMLAAVAHGAEEAWIVQPPVLPLMYLGQYAPTVAKRYLSEIALLHGACSIIIFLYFGGGSRVPWV